MPQLPNQVNYLDLLKQQKFFAIFRGPAGSERERLLRI
jgi:hypothetical protein